MKRWLRYAKPYTLFFILGPLCMIVEVVGEVLMPRFLSMIVDIIDGGGTVAQIVGVCALMILSAVLMMAGGVGGAYFGAKASVNFGTDLRRDVFSKIQRFSFANIDKFSTGSLVTRLTNDVTQVQNFVNTLLRMFLRAPGMLIGGLIMAISMAPNLAAVLAVSVPAILVVLIFIIKVGFPRFGIMQEKVDALNSNIQESITNARVVKSFVREDFETKKFREKNADLKNSGLRALMVMICMNPLTTMIMNFTVVAVVWFGSKMVMGGTMPNGDLIAFISYINQILFSLIMVTMMSMFSSRALAAGKRIAEVLDEKIDIDDENAARKDAVVTDGKVEFKNVNFRYYKNSEGKVLDNVNLVINPGETVGIIGSTGCGKTTLVSLVSRLYDADEGEVLVDGINVRDYSLFNLREGVGMVLQKNVLFSGSIEDNLRWGSDEATIDDIRRACDNAQADGFITSFKDGYDTQLDQGGTNVSGGQKQRLCIARALLKSPKILILDDSTSAVDTATEARIRKAFREELSDSTKIIIAQRISSVIDADKIVVMDDGVITGIGTHDELLAGNTEYQEIYYSQNEKKEGGIA